jgi:hypothetical protein
MRFPFLGLVPHHWVNGNEAKKKLRIKKASLDFLISKISTDQESL